MKKLMPIIMILVVLLSWLVVISSGSSNDSKCSAYISQSEKYIKNGLYIDAIESIKKAQEISPENKDLKTKLLDVYKNASMYDAYESTALELLSEDPNNMDLIILLGDYYTECGKTQDAIDFYKQHLKGSGNKKKILAKLSKFKGKFEQSYNASTYIYPYRNGYYVYQKDNIFGIMNMYGESMLTTDYEYINVFNNDKEKNIAPIKLNDEYCFVDENGYKRVHIEEKYDYVGPFSLEGYAVVKSGGKYGYIDKDSKEYHMTYDYASAFNDGVAVVKKGEKYKIIDSDFKDVTDYKYDGFKVDELSFVSNCQLLCAKKGDKYLLINTKGKEITKAIYDDMDFFATTVDMCAVKEDGLWGFIDLDGKMKIKPKYQEAHSFACGLAPVRLDEKWGYIDENEKMVIEPQFEYARSFNKVGVAAVLDKNWYTIRLIYIEE